MRIFFRFIEIFLVGILLTALALCISASDLVLNKKTVTKEINRSGLYDELNDKIKDQVINELEGKFDSHKELGVDLEELVDNTITVDVLNEETEFILEQIYEDSDKVVLDIDILIDGYSENLKVYLDKNNIDLPDDIDKQIEELKQNSETRIIDVTEYTESISPYFSKFKEISSKIILALSVLIVALLIISVLISTEKLRVVYKPFAFAGILLLIARIVGAILLDSANAKFDNVRQENVYNAIRDTLFSNVVKFIIGYLIFAIVLMIVRIVLSKKKVSPQI